jgi:hypothetical protein
MSFRPELLIGKRFWRCTRAADLACFQFGAHHKSQAFRGEEKEVGDYALHVQCAWRIIRSNDIVVGRSDLFQPKDSGHTPEDFDWTKGNLFDTRVRELFGQGREYEVIGCSMGPAGSLSIQLQSDLKLEVFPDSSTASADYEFWRIFSPSHEGKPPDPAEKHYVVTGSGGHFE